MHRINITLVFFLIFTIVSSGLAYKIILTGYESYNTDYEFSAVNENHKSKQDKKSFTN